MNTLLSKLFFFAGCGAYAYEAASRQGIAWQNDVRIDVIAIAALGVLAHLAFERSGKVTP